MRHSQLLRREGARVLQRARLRICHRLALCVPQHARLSYHVVDCRGDAVARVPAACHRVTRSPPYPASPAQDYHRQEPGDPRQLLVMAAAHVLTAAISPPAQWPPWWALAGARLATLTITLAPPGDTPNLTTPKRIAREAHKEAPRKLLSLASSPRCAAPWPTPTRSPWAMCSKRPCQAALEGVQLALARTAPSAHRQQRAEGRSHDA